MRRAEIQTCHSLFCLYFCAAKTSHEKKRKEKENTKNKRKQKSAKNTHNNKKQSEQRVKGGIEPLGFSNSPTDLKSALQNHWRSFTHTFPINNQLGAHGLHLFDHSQRQQPKNKMHQTQCHELARVVFGVFCDTDRKQKKKNKNKEPKEDKTGVCMILLSDTAF